MKVYIVTTGAYSDYKVRAVVSGEEEAKKLVAELEKEDFNGGYEDYEEFILDGGPK